ncbi:hypothetical protein BH11CYA1_BH11CYA1_36600 [soil metagenome]
MLDPERLTLAQWFWIVFAAVLFIFFACRWIDLYTPVGPLTYIQTTNSRLSQTALTTAS